MPAITPERMTINQRTQLGVEVTAGTDVAGAILLEAIAVDLGVVLELNKYRAMGRKFPRLVTIGNESQAWAFKGKPTADEMIYNLGGLWGSVSPVAQGALGFNWNWKPVLTGPQLPMTFSLQQGDTVRAQKVNFAVETDFSLIISSKDNDISGGGISHPVQDNATLTSSPTVKAFKAFSKPMWNLTADNTALGIGTTTLPTVLNVEFTWGGAQGPVYAINRTGIYKNVVDLEPKAYLKVLLEADTVGMGFLPLARLGQIQYFRLSAVGGMIENSWTVNIGGAAGGTFTIGFNGTNIAAQTPAVTGASLQTLFVALGTVGAGNATITGGAGGPYIVTFVSGLASTLLPLQFNGTALTGGATAPTNWPTAYSAYFDVAGVCTTIAKYSDSQGVYAIEYTFEIFEDPAWNSGQAMQATLINTSSSF